MLLLGGAVATLPRLLRGDGFDYAHVASIERTREYQEPALLRRALALPVAALYDRGGIHFQGNGSFCGPTTVVNLLRSLGTEAGRSAILDGSRVSSIPGVVPGGIPLDGLAGLAGEKSGRRATVLRDLDLATVREHVARANHPARRYLVNSQRGPLFGRGGGHHSPVGGQPADLDLVLVRDVSRACRPWLVKTDRLFAAVGTIDPRSQRKRGLVLVE